MASKIMPFALSLAIYLALAGSTGVWLRHRFALFQRMNDFHWAALVLFDIVAAFALFWPLYLIGVLTKRPLPWTTISTFCAACSAEGKPWAAKSAAVINALFFVLTSQRDHCAQSYKHWAAPLAA